MLRRWLDTYKPRATSSTQVLLAELMWTVVGSGLSIVGLFWVLGRYGNAGLVYVAPFLILGFIKAVLVLDQVLRMSPIPRADVGFVYVAVGFALLVSSRVLWRVWWDMRGPQGNRDPHTGRR